MTIILSKTTHGNFKILSEMVFLVICFVSGQKTGDKCWTKSYIKLADDVPLSIRSNEIRFRNVFYLFFHINLSL